MWGLGHMRGLGVGEVDLQVRLFLGGYLGHSLNS